MSAPVDAEGIAGIDAAWRSRWPAALPIGYELRHSLSETWVRFHSLPESKRYPENAAEYDEVLSRHLTLLAELRSISSTSSTDLLVFTRAISDADRPPAERESDLAVAFPAATFWCSVPHDLSDPDDPLWAHIYVGRSNGGDSDLRALLRLVTSDETGDVIIAPEGLSWLYVPYDGGGDVIAPEQSTRDLLRLNHSDWLSSHPDGV